MELIHPIDATGQVNILTYIINSAMIPILLIVPSRYCFPPTYITSKLLKPINNIINGKKSAWIFANLT